MENGLGPAKERNGDIYDSFKSNVNEAHSYRPTSPQQLTNKLSGLALTQSETATSKSTAEELYFEGCGLEGTIKCIFLCEFHPIAGPKITCQVPDDYVSKEIFDAVSVYIIPKPQLQRSILTVNVLGYKITGYPVRIDNPKYARNAYYFNLCFVCDSWARTVQYEPVIKKLSEYFMMMEEENNFLSNENEEGSERSRLPLMLKQIMEELNSKGISTVIEGTTTMHLKVVKAALDPIQVLDHHVPIFVHDKSIYKEQQWDLTTQQLLPFIDGFNHVAKIAIEANVENNLVKACVQNLLYYGVVSLISIFLYSNVYTATPGLRHLTSRPRLREDCVRYVAAGDPAEPPAFRTIFRLYCSMTIGTTFGDLCARYDPRALHIDERKLVQFGLVHKLIRRVEKYPVYVPSNHSPTHKKPPAAIVAGFGGVASADEICCSTGLSCRELEELIESDPNITVVLK